jgi:hypothetical protein
MFQPRTIKFLAAFIAVFILLLLPAFVWPGYLDSPVGIVVALPYISIYLFHSIGIPGLLQNNGACGWGWCTPHHIRLGVSVHFLAVGCLAVRLECSQPNPSVKRDALKRAPYLKH